MKAPERFTDVSWAGDNADLLPGRAAGRRLGPHPPARGPLADLLRGGRQHPRGQLLDQAPDGPQPLRGRGRRLRSSSSSCVNRLRSLESRLRRLPRHAHRLIGDAPAGQRRRPAARRPRVRAALPARRSSGSSSRAGDELIVADNTAGRGRRGGARRASRPSSRPPSSAPPTSPATPGAAVASGGLAAVHRRRLRPVPRPARPLLRRADRPSAAARSPAAIVGVAEQDSLLDPLRARSQLPRPGRGHARQGREGGRDRATC